jgi:hypothetical protein
MSAQTLRRFLQLDKQQRRIVVAAAVALALTRAGLRVFGFRKWQKFLGSLMRRAPAKIFTGESVHRAREIAKRQLSAERHLFFRASCLEHSLVLVWLLRREGIAGVLRLGGRKQGAQFEAHAWVEVSGTSLDSANGDALEFVPFDGAGSSLETEIP